MLATVGGEKKRFVTNVTVQMSPNFSSIMQQLLSEARAGKFATKADAIKRRDELVAMEEMTPAEPVVSETTPAEPAMSATVFDDSWDVV